MKKLVLIVLLFSCAVSAQENNSSVEPETNGKVEAKDVRDENPEPLIDEDWTLKSAPKIIKVNPFDLISAVPTIIADLEVKMKDPVISLQGGFGFVPDFLQPASGNINDERQFERMDGYMMRFEPRLYCFRGEHHYLSTEFYFRHLRIADEMAIGMEPDNNEFQSYAYFVNADMVFHRFNARVTFKYGIERIFNNGFTMEFYTGLSLRKNWVYSNSTYPSEGELVNTRNWNLWEWNLEDGHEYNYFMPVMGMKFGLNFQK